jgi:hypothetical protein
MHLFLIPCNPQHIITQLHILLRGMIMRFDDTKSDTLNLRVAPSFKVALRAAADRERRSMVNMLEVLLADYCEREGIDIEAKNDGVRRSVKQDQI